MGLAQGPQLSDAGEARTNGPPVSSQALYHWATALPEAKNTYFMSGEATNEIYFFSLHQIKQMSYSRQKFEFSVLLYTILSVTDCLHYMTSYLIEHYVIWMTMASFMTPIGDPRDGFFYHPTAGSLKETLMRIQI